MLRHRMQSVSGSDRHGVKATIVLKAAKSTRSPEFGQEFGLRVAFAPRRLV